MDESYMDAPSHRIASTRLQAPDYKHPSGTKSIKYIQPTARAGSDRVQKNTKKIRKKEEEKELKKKGTPNRFPLDFSRTLHDPDKVIACFAAVEEQRESRGLGESELPLKILKLDLL